MTTSPGPWPEPPPPQCPSCGTAAVRPDARFCRACGAPMTQRDTAPAAADPGGTPAPLSLRRPVWRRPRLLAALAAAVVVAVLAATCQRTAQQEDTDPAAPVADLLELITQKRGGALAAALDVSSPLISDQALARGYEPPTRLRTAGVSYSGADAETRRPDRDTATVAVTYRLGGREHRTSVRVQREATGWVRDWEIADASRLTGELTLTSTHLEQARAAGVQVPTAPPESRLLGAEHAALPGTYTVTTGQHALFAAAQVGTAAVTDRRATTYAIAAADLQVRSGLAVDVSDQIAERLEECAEETVLAPPGCPLRLERDSYRTVEDVSWRVTAQPQIRLVPAEDPALTGAPLAVETTTPGAAEVTYRPVYGGDGTETETVDITIGGSVSLTEDGHAVWEP